MISTLSAPDKVAVIIASYNMPEAADALYEYIVRHTQWQTDIYLVDNASDLVPPAVHTSIQIGPHNKQTTAAFLAGLAEADKHGPYLAYSFMITSTSFPEEIDQDPITPMASLFIQDNNAVGVHASLTPDSTTSWTLLITRGGSGSRRTWMIDNIFSMYRADWFDAMGRFDPELRYAWGIDLETCWLA